MESVQTENIALDTQFFVVQNFLQGNLIKEFAAHGKAYRIKLFITDIVYREVVKQFKQNLVEAKSRNLHNQAKKLYVLHHFQEYAPYFNLPEIDIEKSMGAFSKMFDDWIAENHIRMLPTSELQVGDVFDDYFNRRPPFEEAKKSEFPDAFSLAALKQFFTQRDEKCYMLSGDEGVKKYESDWLITNKTGSDLLGLIVRQYEGEGPVEYIKRVFDQQAEEYKQLAKAELKKELEAKMVWNLYPEAHKVVYRKKSIGVSVGEFSGLQVIHYAGNEFQLMVGLNFSFKAVIEVISVVPGNRKEVEPTVSGSLLGDVTFHKRSVVDLLVNGTYEIDKGVVTFTSYSVSPTDPIENMEDVNE